MIMLTVVYICVSEERANADPVLEAVLNIPAPFLKGSFIQDRVNLAIRHEKLSLIKKTKKNVITIFLLRLKAFV